MPAPVTLVNPPRLRQITRRPSYTREPHMGLAYIAAVLRSAGREVRLIDAEAMHLSAEETAARVCETDPVYVGLTAHTALIKSAAKVAEAVKRVRPESTLVVGGYHSTALPEATLREFQAFDIAVFDEGEETAVELAETLSAGRPLDGLTGIAYRNGEEVVRNPGRPRVDDLDALPLPAWDLFPLSLYQAHYRTDGRIVELPVNTGRGCPGHCDFCARVTGPRVRRRTTESIIREIRHDVERLGAGAIVFFDETFTADPGLTEALCGRLIEEGLNKRIYWLCETRVDCVTYELLRLMKRAGCRHISFGIESGDQEVLRQANKRTDLGRIREAVHGAKKAGILVDNFFILGLPGETARSLRKTVEFAVALDSDFANFFILVPYPGTKVYEMAKRGEGGLRLLTDDWDLYGIQMGKALELESLSRARLERAQFLAYLRFYLRPSKILNMFRIVNLKVVPIYLKNLLSSMFRKKSAQSA